MSTNIYEVSSFFPSFDIALPPREDYVPQVVCDLKPRYKKCTEKEKIKMIVLKRMYKKNQKKVKNRFIELEHLMVM